MSRPNRGTELIWKVYKVLHLEQERERWAKDQLKGRLK